MKYAVKPTLRCVELLSSVSAVQTWAERVRVAAGEALFFTCWLNPKDATYAQLVFHGNKLTSVSGVDASLLSFPLAGSIASGNIASGIVEGFLQGNNFIAARLLDHDGNIMYPFADASAKLRAAGFETLSFRTSQRRGPKEVIDFCLLHNSQAPSTYAFDGITITTADAGLANTLASEKNNPSPIVTYKFADSLATPKEDKKETAESLDVSYGFYGKLPKSHKTYIELAKEAGLSISEEPTYMVVPNTEKIPAKFRGLTNPPVLISTDQFTQIIEDAKKKEN